MIPRWILRGIARSSPCSPPGSTACRTGCNVAPTVRSTTSGAPTGRRSRSAGRWRPRRSSTTSAPTLVRPISGCSTRRGVGVVEIEQVLTDVLRQAGVAPDAATLSPEDPARRIDPDTHAPSFVADEMAPEAIGTRACRRRFNRLRARRLDHRWRGHRFHRLSQLAQGEAEAGTVRTRPGHRNVAGHGRRTPAGSRRRPRSRGRETGRPRLTRRQPLRPRFSRTRTDMRIGEPVNPNSSRSRRSRNRR